MVENLVGYAKRDLIASEVPSLADLAMANIAAAAWCVEVNSVTHSEICAVPAERLATERDLLSVLPSLRPQMGTAAVTRKVDKLSCVRFGSARYSVPNRLIGTSVMLSVTHGNVQVLAPFTGEVLAEHTLVARVRPASATSTTAAPARTGPAAHPGPRPRQRRRSSAWARLLKRSSPARPQPGLAAEH
jgi:hypothetical protein